jgi:hypothetical protein
MTHITRAYFGLRASGYKPNIAWQLAINGHQPDAVIDHIVLGA